MTALASCVTAPEPTGTVELGRLAVLAYAAEHGLRVTIMYRKSLNEPELPRVITPHTLHARFVVAYDHVAHEPRSFRFDRVRGVTI